MTRPTPQDFNEAIQSPALCFHDPDLKAGAVECNQLGLPKAASGAFASVYKVTTASGPWAVRCFLRFLPEQADRYKKVSDFVLFDDLACTVDFHFLEKGISVNPQYAPFALLADTNAQQSNRAAESPKYDIAEVLRATVGEDQRQRKLRLHKKKFRLRGAAVG